MHYIRLLILHASPKWQTQKRCPVATWICQYELSRPLQRQHCDMTVHISYSKSEHASCHSRHSPSYS